MSRSNWKGPFQAKSLFTFLILPKKKLAKIWNKSSTITSNLLSRLIPIYNGRDFKTIYVNRAHLGYKFGSFVTTRFKNSNYKKKPKKSKR
jgi:ribosomal protein S19